MQKLHLGVYGIIHKDDAILLVKKTRGPYTGRWDLPGGKMEHGETPVQALRRELKEETGCEVTSEHLLNVLARVTDFVHEGEEISMHHVGIIFNIDHYDETTLKTAIHEEDVDGCAWIEKTNITEETVSPFVWSITRE